MSLSTTHSMYYVAIVCPAEVDEKVAHCKQWMKEQYSCAVALKSPAHITIIPPFWLENSREAELQKALESFISDMDETEIQLEGFSHFGKKALFIRVKENPALDEIKMQTEIHFIQSFGAIIKVDDRPFHPHITIATRDLKPSDFVKAWQHFSNKAFHSSFRTKTISLFKLDSGKWNVISEKSWKQ